MSATTENRKFDKNDRFKERKQLRLLLQWLKHRLRKTDDSQDIRNVQKNQTMKLTRTLFASLLWSDWNCIKTQKLFNGAPASTSWPVMSKSVTLAGCRRDIQEQKKGETRIVVPVRIELTALALSAPRSAHWANGPDKIVTNVEAWYHADEEGIFRHKKLRRITHSTICINSTNIADFNIFSIIHLKHFQAHTVFTRISGPSTKHLSVPRLLQSGCFFGKAADILSLRYNSLASVNPVSIFYFYYRRRS